MDHSVKASTSRERRRRRLNEEKHESEDNDDIVIGQNNVAEKGKSRSSRILVRRDTFTVSKPRAVFDDSSPYEKGKEESSLDEDDVDIIAQNSSDNSNMRTHTFNVTENKTYDLEKVSKHDTYSIQNIELGEESGRPVPAPRKRQSIVAKESDKNSSDTDKDIMDIEADETVLSNYEEPLRKETFDKVYTFQSDAPAQVPKPKPRKLSSISKAHSSFPKMDSMSKSKSLEEITVKIVSPRSIRSDPEPKPTEDSSRIKSDEISRVSTDDEKSDKKSRELSDIVQHRKEKKTFSSKMRLEKARIPTISSILKDFKDDARKTRLEEEKIDFEIDSPRLRQSSPNEKMYVQYKNGFYLKNREDVFGQDRERFSAKGGIDDPTNSTMLKTAMQFQEYWSRSMLYFHGVLAGFGFGHAFAVSAVLFYLHHEPEGFIDVYACLALKIHFIFYTLIALCIISCLDRLDVGNLSKKHWENICRNCPGLWFTLILYFVSFLLTFVNQRAESRFDSHQYENITGERLWDPEIEDDVPEIFFSWYRIVWARDVIVLAAWLLISLTEYPDKLHLYVKDLSSRMENGKFGESKISTVASYGENMNINIPVNFSEAL